MGSIETDYLFAGNFGGALFFDAGQIANQLAIAIRQADLYAQTQQHAAEMELRVVDRTDGRAAGQVLRAGRATLLAWRRGAGRQQENERRRDEDPDHGLHILYSPASAITAATA